jgi:hypothetical protein
METDVISPASAALAGTVGGLPLSADWGHSEPGTKREISVTDSRRALLPRRFRRRANGGDVAAVDFGRLH